MIKILTLAAIVAMSATNAFAAESAECKAARIVAAYTWLALDDAERNALSSEVVNNLEMELGTATEVAHAVCEG